jgi:hypothetical protein
MTNEKDEPMNIEPLLLPEVHRSLLAAARRRSTPSAPHRPLPPARKRAIGLAAVASVLIGGTALAATAPWSPTVGDDDRGHPTTVATAVPGDQLQALAVLRRPQDETDRTPGVAALLTLLSPDIGGVHTASVRALNVRTDGTTVLFAAERFGENQPGSPGEEKRDVVCMLYGTDTTIVNGARTKGDLTSGQKCGTTQDLRAGRILLGAQWAGRLELNGLVPDGVTKVSLTLRTGEKIDAPVENNSFHIDSPAPDGSYEDAPIRWLDDGGRELPRD